MSKNDTSRFARPLPPPELKVDAVSWNISGDSGPNPISSPSSTTDSTSNDATSSHTAGSRSVTSLRLRVNNETSEPVRWICNRMPSSLACTTDSPSSPNASVTEAEVAANIGCTPLPTSSPIASRPSRPSSSATSATAPRSPVNMAARRTEATGTPAALAIAVVITPSRAPCRRPPVRTDARNSPSASVAAPSRPPSRSARAAFEPDPEIAEISSIAKSTSATVNEVCSLAAKSRSRTAAQPTPIRPWRISPVNRPTTIGASAGSSCFSSSPSAPTLSLRAEASATAVAVATTAANAQDPITGR